MIANRRAAGGDPDGSNDAEVILRLAHRLRGSLSLVRTSAQLALHRCPGQDAVSTQLDKILVQVVRIDTLMRRVEQLALVDEAPMSDIDADSAIAESVARWGGRAARACVELRVACRETPRMRGNHEQLVNALDELVDNALRHSPPEGAITLACEPLENGIAIHVHDEGPGVADEHRGLILQPFFSTNPERSGIGLNLVERICAAMGGTLRWANLPERGCRFTIQAPINLGGG